MTPLLFLAAFAAAQSNVCPLRERLVQVCEGPICYLRCSGNQRLNGSLEVTGTLHATTLLVADAGIYYTSSNTFPPSPPSGAVHYDYRLDAGFPASPMVVDSLYGSMPVGLMSIFTNYGTTQNWEYGCTRPTGWAAGSLTYLLYGNAILPTVNGSQTSPAWANTTLLTRSRNIRMATASGANNSAAVRNSIESAWRGNAANAGGFVYWTRLELATVAANIRFAAGLFNTVLVLTATADPNTQLDAVYFGCNSGDSNLSICSNDNVGTATCTTLGGSYPCITNGALYDFWLAAPPNGSAISYCIERLDVPAAVCGSVTSDLPRNSVQLTWQNWLNTGSNVTAMSMGNLGECILVNL